MHLSITPDFGVIEGFLSDGNRADILFADELTKNVSGCYVLEDKGYDSDKHREKIMENHNIPVIPGRKNRLKPIEYDKEKFSIRRKIEHFFWNVEREQKIGSTL